MKVNVLWCLIWVFCGVMVFCAVMDFYVWFFYCFHVPSWCFAVLFLMFPLMIFGVKRLTEDSVGEKVGGD